MSRIPGLQRLLRLDDARVGPNEIDDLHRYRDGGADSTIFYDQLEGARVAMLRGD